MQIFFQIIRYKKRKFRWLWCQPFEISGIVVYDLRNTIHILKLNNTFTEESMTWTCIESEDLDNLVIRTFTLTMRRLDADNFPRYKNTKFRGLWSCPFEI